MLRLNKTIFILLILLFLFPSLFAQQERFIAILPFTNTGSAQYDWVARGIEEILYDKFSNLNSVQVFEKVTLDRILKNRNIRKESDLTVRKAFALGKETGVDVLLTGNYQSSGNKLNLKFRLISTYTGSDILNKTFRGQISDIFRLHEQGISKCLEVMQLPISSSERQMLGQVSTNSIRAFEYYCNAYLKFQNGANMDIVARYFTNALKEDPDFWEAQYNLGVIYYNFDKFNKAIDQFKSVLKKNPDFYKPYYGLGVIYYLKNQFNEAIRRFERVLKLAPDHDRSLYYLGRVYVKMGSIEKGLDLLNRSAEINPNYAPTHYYIGIANLERGWYKTAIQALKESLDMNAKNYRAHNALGQSYYRLQRFDEAIYEYKKAIEIRKDYSTAYFNLGNAVYKRGALAEIVDAYLDILETRYSNNGAGSNNNGSTELVADLQRMKREQSNESEQVYTRMINSYRKALKHEPDFFEVSFNLALTYENLGQIDSAEVYYKKSLKSNPDLVRAHMRLGRLYESQQRYDEALKQFKEVVKIEPSYFSETPRLGEKYRYINIIEEVLKEYQLKHELNPKDPEILLVLARIFNSLGRYGQAEDYYSQIVRLDPTNREAAKELKDLRQDRKKL